MRAGWLLAAAACGHATDARIAPPKPDAPPVEDVRLTVGYAPDALTVEVAGAWIDDDGGGRGVDAVATVPGAPALVVTGATSSWDLRRGVVVFEGDVVAVRGDLELRCERIAVAYDGERVASAEASGDVRLSQGARRVVADRAVLSPADGVVVLDGHPTVTDGPNRLSGDRVTVWLDTDRLECDRCRLEVSADALTPP